MDRSATMRVLFVCIGNICRSPTAEAMAREISAGTVEAESAGIAAIPGNRATPEAVRAARERGFDLSGHEARFVGDIDLDSYDLIVALTPSIGERLRRNHGMGNARVVAFDIEDPYGGDLDEYRQRAVEIEDAVRRLLARADPA